jgi:inner membrane protein
MDNITHTLIGTLVGESTAIQRQPRTTESELRGRDLIVWIGAIGSNFPDSDLLYTMFAQGKLSYLIQHRGYTHTIVGALLAGLLLATSALAFARARKWSLSTSDRRRIVAMSFFTPLLHIGMDFTNNYGVHPFWPWHDGWFYGDSIFIIEPLLWAACAPLAFTLRSTAGRLLVCFVLIAALVLPLATSLVPWPGVIAIAAMAGLLLWIAYCSKRTLALGCAIACWLSVTATFAIAHSQAEHVVRRVNQERFPDERSLDAVLTPLPANPFCWETLFVQITHEKLVLRRAMLAIAPSIIDASTCPTRSLDRPTTAPLAEVSAANSKSIAWYGEMRSDLQSLRELNQTNCEAATFFRFARTPWFAIVNHQRVLGDLRFDREQAIGFSEIALSGKKDCGRSAPWLPPRSDVLEPAR